MLMEGKTLTNICRLDTMPKYSTVCQWLATEPEFAEKYTRAREVQADYFADETVDIADNEPDPAVAKVKIDARKWHAGKTRPKKYGDKVMQEVTGADGGPQEHTVIAATAGTPEEFDEFRKHFLK